MKKSEGLGDSIDKITTATGIKALVKWISGDDCNCNSRQDKLNKMFPYNRKQPLCLNEDEHKWLTDFFTGSKRFPKVEIETRMAHIHARVFQHHHKSICGKCNKGAVLNRYINEVEQIYKTYL